MIGRRSAFSLFATGFASSVHAQGAPMADAFAGWMARHGVTSGTISLAVDGRLVLVRGFGGRDPAAQGPIWSLSKFITGLAVARLVAEGKLSLDLPLSRAMPRRLAQHGAAGSPLAALTLAQLLTHRSGLPRDPGGEAVPGLRALLRYRHPRDITTEQLAPALLAQAPARPPGESYEYSNANFLLAGFAVEEAAGEPYAAFAAREVLARLGIRRPALDRDWGLLGATGGWALNGAEYLALLLRSLHGPSLLSPDLRRWMGQPDGKTTEPGGPIFYSLGLLGRVVPGGQNRWHHGSWRFRWPGWSIDESGGTFAVVTPSRAAWFASFAPHPGEAVLRDLDRTLLGSRPSEPAAGRMDLFSDFVDRPR